MEKTFVQLVCWVPPWRASCLDPTSGENIPKGILPIEPKAAVSNKRLSKEVLAPENLLEAEVWPEILT